MTSLAQYDLYYKFIKTYAKTSYEGIDRKDALMLELEDKMASNDQFFYIADMIAMKVLFASKRSQEMIGVDPDVLSLYQFMDVTHPDDLKRLSLGLSKVIRIGQEIFIEGKGFEYLSSNFRMRNAEGVYSNILTQNYMFHSSSPHKTVYLFKVHTNINWCKKILSGYHYYVGKDLSFFRYPDKEMLMMGNVFTNREFEIIKMVEMGMSTEQIAGKLFISPYTVNTHRSNILKKTEKNQISELIYELKERGVLL